MSTGLFSRLFSKGDTPSSTTPFRDGSEELGEESVSPTKAHQATDLVEAKSEPDSDTKVASLRGQKGQRQRPLTSSRKAKSSIKREDSASEDRKHVSDDDEDDDKKAPNGETKEFMSQDRASSKDDELMTPLEDGSLIEKLSIARPAVSKRKRKRESTVDAEQWTKAYSSHMPPTEELPTEVLEKERSFIGLPSMEPIKFEVRPKELWNGLMRFRSLAGMCP